MYMKPKQYKCYCLYGKCIQYTYTLTRIICMYYLLIYLNMWSNTLVLLYILQLLFFIQQVVFLGYYFNVTICCKFVSFLVCLTLTPLSTLPTCVSWPLSVGHQCPTHVNHQQPARGKEALVTVFLQYKANQACSGTLATHTQWTSYH